MGVLGGFGIAFKTDALIWLGPVVLNARNGADSRGPQLASPKYACNMVTREALTSLVKPSSKHSEIVSFLHFPFIFRFLLHYI